MELSLGEALETIFNTRKSGLFGDFVSAYAATPEIMVITVRVDGITYTIRHNITPGAPWCWCVVRQSDGAVAYDNSDAAYGLAYMDESSFKAEVA